MIQLRWLLVLPIVFLCACNEELKSDTGNNLVLNQEEGDPVFYPKLAVHVPLMKAVTDHEALKQVGQYRSDKPESIYDLYDQSEDEVMAWTDKLWGRCCTEADMRFTEFLGFNISATVKNTRYPFSNALDNLFATAYVVQPEDSVRFNVTFDGETNMYGRLNNKVGSDLITKEDTIQSRFQMSIVNGYAKSAKTFIENARIKTVELWLNGEHKCNCRLLDKADIQIIQGNFPLFKSDQIVIIPIDYYEGEKYTDVCISAFQQSLGYGAHKKLDELSKHWGY